MDDIKKLRENKEGSDIYIALGILQEIIEYLKPLKMTGAQILIEKLTEDYAELELEAAARFGKLMQRLKESIEREDNGDE